MKVPKTNNYLLLVLKKDKTTYKSSFKGQGTRHGA